MGNSDSFEFDDSMINKDIKRMYEKVETLKKEKTEVIELWKHKFRGHEFVIFKEKWIQSETEAKNY